MKVTQTVPTLVTLAEWVNAGRCPPEVLYEAGRLYVELRRRTPERPELRAKLAALGAKYGTVALWDGAREFRAFDRIEVNADSVVCRWRPWADEGRPHPAEVRAIDDWWRRTFPERDSPDPPERKYESSLDTLLTQWHDTPEAVRPTRFPLDPVVLAWMVRRESDSPVPSVELSLQDYIPNWQRYRKDVRRAVKKDAKEKNGQDVHTGLAAALEKNGKLPTEAGVDLLIGLLRAANCELHTGACETTGLSHVKGAGVCPLENRQGIESLIVQLGRLGDVDHGRVERALYYAESHEKYEKGSHLVRDTYRVQR